MAINSTTAASRQAWSFARDEGMPFPLWFKRITVVRKTPLPVNAMVRLISVIIVAVSGLIPPSDRFSLYMHLPCPPPTWWL